MRNCEYQSFVLIFISYYYYSKSYKNDELGLVSLATRPIYYTISLV